MPNPCLNGGNCVNITGGYMCDCVAGFTGVNCTTDIDDCDLDPCDNNGTCIDEFNGYMCNCRAGFTASAIFSSDLIVANIKRQQR